MVTITEDYVSFKTAKLLREKGFKESTLAYAYGQDMVDYYSQPKVTDDYNVEAGRYPLPTLQMAVKWLREVQGLFISIEPCFDYELKHVVYLAFIQNVTDIDTFKEGRVEVASGYIVEAVYGKALKYCLENLI